MEKAKNLISNDISRCNNAECLINVFCARFMQISIDKKQNKYASVSNLNEENGFCKYFIAFQK